MSMRELPGPRAAFDLYNHAKKHHDARWSTTDSTAKKSINATTSQWCTGHALLAR
eukprot:m.226491 g.226491  ORF g.226491 m.226491 type:complete len:55 (-) comp19219_c0_seq42:2730-2894(-)